VKSTRTPSLPTRYNGADEIERYLGYDNHRVWGFVIFRCVYHSDEDWSILIERLREDARCSLASSGGLDLFDSLSLTVIEHKSLDGASTATVRDKFTEWILSTIQEEQGNSDPATSQRYAAALHEEKPLKP
jgi:hypothetical protein